MRYRARTDLCGGRRATGVPTAILRFAIAYFGFVKSLLWGFSLPTERSLRPCRSLLHAGRVVPAPASRGEMPLLTLDRSQVYPLDEVLLDEWINT